MLEFIKIALTLLVVSQKCLFIHADTSQGQATQIEETTINYGVQNSSSPQEPDEAPSVIYPKIAVDIVDSPFHDLNFSVGTEIYSEKNLDLVYHYFEDINYYDGKLTLSELNFVALLGRVLYAVLDDLRMQRYGSLEKLRQHFGPHINDDLCIAQLEHLNRRLVDLERQKFNSTDLNLYRLLDSYGRISPGLTSGDVFSPGMYENCIRMHIDSPEGKLPTRYCLATLRDSRWSRDSLVEASLGIKVGVCLPQACDPLRYKNKFELIQRLIDFNAKRIDKNQLVLHSLYCLPDEDSPMRTWWLWPKTVLAVAAFGLWFSILVFATIKYECLKGSMKDGVKISTGSLKKDDDLRSDRKEQLEKSNNKDDRRYEIYKMLSITYNLKELLSVSKSKTASKAIIKQESTVPITQSSHKPTPTNWVDLECIDGLRVLSMFPILTFHWYFYSLNLDSNVRNSSGQELLNVFIVNSFFAISGVLTCYLQLDKRNWRALLLSPTEWFSYIRRRYLRIMPVYGCIVLYCKYISKFTGSGPSWDYATNTNSLRGYCENESWFWTLTLSVNLKQTAEHCVPSAWYLGNDFQFYLVAPIFLAALQWRPAFGKRLLLVCMGVCNLLGIYYFWTHDVTDMRSLANLMPHALKFYLAKLMPSYARPQYRIAAYLCGLLMGHALLNYKKTGQQAAQAAHKPQDKAKAIARPKWPNWFINHGHKLSLGFFLFLFVVGPPVVLSGGPFGKPLSWLITTFGATAFHTLYALAVGGYILLATTGHGVQAINRLLSAPIWKPLAKLSLCTLAINMEICFYVAQAARQQVYVDFFTRTAYTLLTIVLTYLVSTVIYLVIEAPVAAVVDRLSLAK